jgi:O-antigen/teichoic acid export membrane protein
MDDRAERPSAHGPRSLRQFLDQLGPVAAGLIVLGIGSFAFLGLAGRALGPVDFAPVATLWVLFNAAALAFYQPIEQELGRATADRVATGTGSRPVLIRCLIVGGSVTAVLTVLVLVFLQPVSEQVFNGRTTLALLFLVGLVGLFAEHVMRGLFSGNTRFGRYGWQLTVDGLLRIVLPGALVVAAAGTTTSLSAALVVAPLLAAGLTAGRLTSLTRPGPPIPWGDVLPALGTLTAAAVLSQLIVNAAPLAAQILATPAEADRVGVFIAALVMTRIPLFFFGAVQATFLPSLARLSALGDRHGFLRQTRLVLAGVSGAGALFVLGLAVVGPWVLRLLYGPAFDSTREVLVALGLGAAAYMVAQALAQALIALRAYRAPLYAWAGGSAVFFATLALPLSLEARVAGALMAGGGIAALVMAALLVRALRGLHTSIAAIPDGKPNATSPHERSGEQTMPVSHAPASAQPPIHDRSAPRSDP